MICFYCENRRSLLCPAFLISDAERPKDGCAAFRLDWDMLNEYQRRGVRDMLSSGCIGEDAMEVGE